MATSSDSADVPATRAGPTTEIPDGDPARVVAALAELGRSEPARLALFRSLREMEGRAPDRPRYRDDVRWPLVQAALAKAGAHRVVLRDGLVFEVSLLSRIERALLLSAEEHPDHVWEPQTTRLLLALASGATDVIGGAPTSASTPFPSPGRSARTPDAPSTRSRRCACHSLRADLERRGHAFRSDSGPESILHLHRVRPSARDPVLSGGNT